MEPGNKFLRHGCGIVAHGLLVPNEILCVNHANGVFLNVHNVRFDSSPERIQFSMRNA
jgi:hypothetical protein